MRLSYLGRLGPILPSKNTIGVAVTAAAGSFHRSAMRRQLPREESFGLAAPIDARLRRSSKSDQRSKVCQITSCRFSS